MNKELIEAVKPVIPAKGKNAGRQMFVINGSIWANVEPKLSDTHVVWENSAPNENGEVFKNVVGFSNDLRMGRDEKLAILTGYDAAYSVAIATLLR